jgi:DNA replication ATP-dependent helicase Dna2
MSFATTSPPRGERRDFLTNPNRLNVALTRAKRKLVLVGCVPALEKLPYFDRLLTYCRGMNTLFEYT